MTFGCPTTAAFVLGRRGGANSGIWQADMQRHSETSLREPGDQFAIWSPNDAQLAFRRVVNDVGQLFISSVRGGDKDHLLLETRQTKTPLDWSSDGTTLLYQVQTPDTGFDVWAVKVNEGTPFPVLHTAADEGGVVFSPDGRWIAYQSNESGRPQIYVQAFPSGGRRWQVSRDGGTRPMWRPIDGRELFYLAPDLNLVSVPLTVTDEGRAIQADAAAPLFQTELSFTSSLGMPRPNYAVSADGKRFLLVETEGSTATPLTVVLHWRAAVGR